MSTIGMSKYSESSFDERIAIGILENLLESKRGIKTFFKQNDRTPNSDGTFELLAPGQESKKQFIVQIKKVSNLKPEEQGKNKGKYLYNLETNFLYYVKERVTESPAIYFVVDIATNNVFWLYLSDEKLMELNFEGKGKVQYAFSKDEILSNINLFTQYINRVAKQRNEKFIYKSKDEISEIQEVVGHINNLFDNDLSFIKRKMFPNLWRFGVKYSKDNNFSISIGNQTYRPKKVGLFALYPQIKGNLDTGVREFRFDFQNYFNNIDASGTLNPSKYVQTTITKIIGDYFKTSFPITACPDIALEENIFKFIDENSDILADLDFSKSNPSIKNIEDFLVGLSKYMLRLIICTDLTSNEEQLRQNILIKKTDNSSTIRSQLKLTKLIQRYHCVQEFRQFICNVKKKNPPYATGQNQLPLYTLDKDFQLAFLSLRELQERHINQIHRPWSYDWQVLKQLPEKILLNQINQICEKWFTLLPDLYKKTYFKIFYTNKYYNVGKFEYSLKIDKDIQGLGCIEEEYGKYKVSEPTDFQIKRASFNMEQIQKFAESEKNQGLIVVGSSVAIDALLANRTPIYDSLRCLIYQGICKGLDIKCNGIPIKLSPIKVFN